MPLMHRCDNCSNVHPESSLLPILDLLDRVDAGGTVPSGECPDCGSLCYPTFQVDDAWEERFEAADQSVVNGLNELRAMVMEAKMPVSVAFAGSFTDKMYALFREVLVFHTHVEVEEPEPPVQPMVWERKGNGGNRREH